MNHFYSHLDFDMSVARNSKVLDSNLLMVRRGRSIEIAQIQCSMLFKGMVLCTIKNHLSHSIRVGHSTDYVFSSVAILPSLCTKQRKTIFTDSLCLSTLYVFAFASVCPGLYYVLYYFVIKLWIHFSIFPPQGSASPEVADEGCDLERSGTLWWEDTFLLLAGNVLIIYTEDVCEFL